MADENLDDAEFWLPSQFLVDDNDDVVSTDNDTAEKKDDKINARLFGFGSGSDLSDDEAFHTELSLQVARTSLDDRLFIKNDNGKALNLSASPQSTLCALTLDQSSSQGSPNDAVSRVSSPPPQISAPETWDLLNAAAGEVAKIRTTTTNAGVADFHKQLFDQQKQYQILRHQKQLQCRRLQQQYRYHSTQIGRTPLGLPQSAWPSLQQARDIPNGSGLKTVIPGTPSESVGTGVFLPRQPVAQPQTRTRTRTRKKQGFPTVIVPARVVQALNLNLNAVAYAQPIVQPRVNSRVPQETDVTARQRSNNNGVVSHPKRNNIINNNNNVKPQTQVNNEIRLPKDWTY